MLYNSANLGHEGLRWPSRMLKLTTAVARRDLADVIKTVRTTKQRAVITRYGLPLVAIVPIEDLVQLGQSVSRPRKRKPARKRDKRRV
jgi:prevent-host-death family protein